MSTVSETERNEAVCVLEKALKERESTYTHSISVKERIEREPEVFSWKWEDEGYWVLVYENYPKYIKELQTAIAALKQKSEAERRIEGVREYCENAIGEELYSLPHTEKEIMYIEMKQAVANYILEILEGKAE